MIHCPDGASLYIFDFCNTVYKSNTTNDYLRFLVRSAGFSYKIRLYTTWIVAKLLKDAKLISPQRYMKTRILALKGLERRYLVHQAGEFLEEELSGKVIEESLTLLLQVKSSGKRIIVLSNTLHLILEPFARKYHIDEYHASELNFDDKGRCLGTYEMHMESMGKLNYISRHHSEDMLGNAFFITDDPKADSDILDFVKYPVVLKGKRC